MRPDHPALGIYEGIAPLMDVLHNVVQTHLELREAVVPERTDLAWCRVCRLWHVGRRRAVFDAMAIVGERIRAGVADALPVVLLQAGEVPVGDGDHFLA